MTHQEHIERHKELHQSLDELIADMIAMTDRLPSKTSVMELMQWSYLQTINPSEHREDSTLTTTQKVT